MLEPLVQGQRHFTQIFFSEGVLVPQHELQDTESLDKREVDRKIKGGIFRIPRRIEGTLHNGSLAAQTREGHDGESARMNAPGYSDVWKSLTAAHGSLAPFLSLESRSFPATTWTLRSTTNISPGWGFKTVLLPTARIGFKRVAEVAALLRARPSFLG